LQELNEVVSFYGLDLNFKLNLTNENCSQWPSHHLQFCVIRKCFQSLSSTHLSLLSHVCLLVKLIALMPATNAVSERRASALRHVKTYLRSSMTQVRLNNMMVLHVHKALTDTINVISILTEFSTANEERRKYLAALI